MKSIYTQLRQQGESAANALRAHRAVERFNQLDGRVRIQCEPEQEYYFSVYGEPEGYVTLNGRRVSPEQERKEITDSIERLGCWVVFTEYLSPTGEWEIADSVGMCAGYVDPLSPVENCYVPDLMLSAIDAWEKDWDEAGMAV